MKKMRKALLALLLSITVAGTSESAGDGSRHKHIRTNGSGTGG